MLLRPLFFRCRVGAALAAAHLAPWARAGTTARVAPTRSEIMIRPEGTPQFFIDNKADAPKNRCVRCILDIPRAKGKKQEGVGRKGEGRRKNLDRGNLPNLAHPVESRGRQGQAERVGSEVVGAANQLRGRLLQPRKTFSFRACSFCLMVLLYRRTTGFSSDN